MLQEPHRLLRQAPAWALVPLLAIAAMAAGSPPAAAQTKAGDVLVRLRGLYVLVPNDDHIPLGGLGPADTVVLMGDDAVPELDVSYFLTDHIALELIAATSRHKVGATAEGFPRFDIGKVSTLPPTLMLQYHLPVAKGWKPYLGVGVNYTILFDAKAAPDLPFAEIHAKDHFGWAVGAGIDRRIGDGPWFVNLDVKKLFVRTTLKGPGRVPVTRVNLNPWLLGFGFGYRF